MGSSHHHSSKEPLPSTNVPLQCIGLVHCSYYIDSTNPTCEEEILYKLELLDA